MRESLRSRKVKAIGAVLTLAALAGSLWWITFTPLFGAKTLTVRGGSHLSEGEVLALAGLAEGTNVFHLDVAKVERALEASPWVASAAVTVDLPSTVLVEIEERVPVVATTDGLAVAADGIVLPGAPTDDLPRVGSATGLTDEARSGAARAVDAMAPVVRAKVSSIVALPGDDLVFELRDGTSVSWGRPGEEAEKAAALRAVLVWAGEQQLVLKMIDVGVPTAPTATLPDGTAVSP